MNDRGTNRPATRGVHHTAFRCRDADETRTFYEGVLGLPLAHALVGENKPSTGTVYPFMHLFFDLGDGNLIAFFEAPDDASPEKFERASGFDRHVAFELADFAALAAMKSHLESHDIEVAGPIDHGFVQSIYFFDPNGLQLEFTARHPEYDTRVAMSDSALEALLAEWRARVRPSA